MFYVTLTLRNGSRTLERERKYLDSCHRSSKRLYSQSTPKISYFERSARYPTGDPSLRCTQLLQDACKIGELAACERQEALENDFNELGTYIATNAYENKDNERFATRVSQPIHLTTHDCHSRRDSTIARSILPRMPAQILQF